MNPVEVVNILNDRFWLLVEDHKYFLSFEDFPWFKNAKTTDIRRVKLLHGYHLYWPTLDVDLELSSFGHLESYPLIYR